MEFEAEVRYCRFQWPTEWPGEQRSDSYPIGTRNGHLKSSGVTKGSNMLQTLERLERILEIATEEGISVRCEWLGGVRGGLVRLGKTPILFVDESLSMPDQLEQVQSSLTLLDWSESEWWDEMRALLELIPAELST